MVQVLLLPASRSSSKRSTAMWTGFLARGLKARLDRSGFCEAVSIRCDPTGFEKKALENTREGRAEEVRIGQRSRGIGVVKTICKGGGERSRPPSLRILLRRSASGAEEKVEIQGLAVTMAKNDQKSNLRKDAHLSESDRCGFLP